VRYKGASLDWDSLNVFIFNMFHTSFMLLAGLNNLGTTPRTAEKSEGFRLSTPVEKPVDNSKTAPEAG
jgi:hypothetical protein